MSRKSAIIAPFRPLTSTVSFRDVPPRAGEDKVRFALDEVLSNMSEGEKRNYPIDEDTFFRLFRSYIKQDDVFNGWDSISQPEELITSYETLKMPNDSEVSTLLDKLVVLKLNGGLGTSMGCSGPKSLVPVRDGCTFLDLTCEQLSNLNSRYHCDVPLVLMNSFSTDYETERALNKIGSKRPQIYTFEQNRFPRISAETGIPFKSSSHQSLGDQMWYPPGHGDVYRSFHKSGLLEKFINDGKEWLYISNIDNLGATVDAAILNYLCTSQMSEKPCDFLMEVTQKTQTDIKGGTLVQFEKKLRLLEMAQIPNSRLDEFMSVKKYKYFNTNNLWINMKSMTRLLGENKIKMELIVNKKTLKGGVKVIQLEEAVGAAVHNFDSPRGLNVPRQRFLPVKLTSDLMMVMSDLYELNNGSIKMSPKRNFPTLPMVKLGAFYKNIADFQERLVSIPSLLELDHLTVSGDVKFDKDVTLKGTVIIVAQENEKIEIPCGTKLENKIITGNLRVLPY